MITLYDHVQELSAELRGCYFTRRERAAVQAELDHAFDAALEALSDPTEQIGAPRKRPLPSSAALRDLRDAVLPSGY